jgi:hypothetical protein
MKDAQWIERPRVGGACRGHPFPPLADAARPRARRCATRGTFHEAREPGDFRKHSKLADGLDVGLDVRDALWGGLRRRPPPAGAPAACRGARQTNPQSTRESQK